MADDPAGSVSPEGTPDIEALMSQVAEREARIKGFQTALNRKDEERKKLEREIEELKTAGLSDDERAQLRDEKLKAENERLRQENELLKLSSDYGDEMPYFQKLLSASSAQEQLEVMRELRAGIKNAQASAPAAPAGNEGNVPDVLPNNPPRASDQGYIALPDGTPMSEQMADAILRRIPAGGLFRR